MSHLLLVDLRDKKIPSSIGGKAFNLRLLMNPGFRIPQTMVIPWEAHERYRRNDETLAQDLHAALANRISATQLYAVRSSANIEDSLRYSFAGQFKSCFECADC